MLFILLGFSSLIIQAQISWEPGYVILKGQDSITGFILERTDAEMAHFIKFKKDTAKEFQVYKAGEIAGFGFINGRTYESQSFVDDMGTKNFCFCKKIL